MIQYKNSPDNNVVEICVDGEITATDFNRTAAQLEADLKKHGKLRILEEIRNFRGGNPLLIWKGARFGVAHIYSFTHAAVVTEARWMRSLSDVVNSVLPAKVKAFERSQVEEARRWLSNVEADNPA